MYCCDDDDLEAFILKVRKLAKENHKLALLAIDQEDGRLAADIETLPKPKNCDSLCRKNENDKFPPLNLKAKEIRRSISFNITTFANSPESTMICGPDLHGDYVCYPPW